MVIWTAHSLNCSSALEDKKSISVIILLKNPKLLHNGIRFWLSYQIFISCAITVSLNIIANTILKRPMGRTCPMKKTISSIIILVSILICPCLSQTKLPKMKLMPYPNKLIERNGTFLINSKTTLSINSDRAQRLAKLLGDFLKEHSPISGEIEVAGNGGKNSINLF